MNSEAACGDGSLTVGGREAPAAAPWRAARTVEDGEGRGRVARGGRGTVVAGAGPRPRGTGWRRSAALIAAVRNDKGRRCEAGTCRCRWCRRKCAGRYGPGACAGWQCWALAIRARSDLGGGISRFAGCDPPLPPCVRRARPQQTPVVHAGVWARCLRGWGGQRVKVSAGLTAGV